MNINPNATQLTMKRRFPIAVLIPAEESWSLKRPLTRLKITIEPADAERRVIVAHVEKTALTKSVLPVIQLKILNPNVAVARKRVMI